MGVVVLHLVQFRLELGFVFLLQRVFNRNPRCGYFFHFLQHQSGRRPVALQIKPTRRQLFTPGLRLMAM